MRLFFLLLISKGQRGGRQVLLQLFTHNYYLRTTISLTHFFWTCITVDYV